MDFKPILIDYMVENGLKFAQDVDWKALTKLPEFRGLNITFYYVLCVHKYLNILQEPQLIISAGYTALTFKGGLPRSMI